MNQYCIKRITLVNKEVYYIPQVKDLHYSVWKDLETPVRRYKVYDDARSIIDTSLSYEIRSEDFLPYE